VSALLHDIGKIAVPEDILKKPGSLTSEEFAIIKKHPTIGTELVKELKNFNEISKGILFHHERIDGHGYPNGTGGSDIPLTARIIAVADSFDAMTSNRPYRSRLSDQAAMDEILKNQGKQFDEKVAQAFYEAFKKNLIPREDEKFPSLLQLRKLTVGP
jgi:HD-GYP domain-containing protein (c-di-GMP phosphodiesterase class II)